MFTVSVLLIDQNWEQPRCPWSEWIHKRVLFLQESIIHQVKKRKKKRGGGQNTCNMAKISKTLFYGEEIRHQSIFCIISFLWNSGTGKLICSDPVHNSGCLWGIRPTEGTVWGDRNFWILIRLMVTWSILYQNQTISLSPGTHLKNKHGKVKNKRLRQRCTRQILTKGNSDNYTNNGQISLQGRNAVPGLIHFRMLEDLYFSKI